MKIKMFTKNDCPNCKLAKQQLAYVPVELEIEEVNIETDITLIEGLSPADYLSDRLESMSVPTFEFESGEIVRGFEMGKIQKALGL